MRMQQDVQNGPWKSKTTILSYPFITSLKIRDSVGPWATVSYCSAVIDARLIGTHFDRQQNESVEALRQVPVSE